MGKVEIICAWCGKVIRIEEWEGQTGTSHGICSSCEDKVLKKLRDKQVVKEGGKDGNG